MKKYLVFDIECANSLEGVCKMCSLGYVVFDDKFNIIEKRDIIVNPESSFDWYLLRKKSKTRLAHPREYYEMFEPFPRLYQEIKRILETNYFGIFGFDVMNDLKYIYDSCERYKLKQIKIKGYDVRKILNDYDNYSGGLSRATEEYVNDSNLKLTSHKSDDDSEMTMKVLEAICVNMEVSIAELINLIDLEELEYDPNDKFNFNSTKPEGTKPKGRKKVVSKTLKLINSYYRQKNDNPKTTLLSGIRFCVSGAIKKDENLTLTLFETIFNNDGQIFMPLDDGQYLITKDKEDSIRLQEIIKLDRIKLIELNDFLKQVNNNMFDFDLIT